MNPKKICFIMCSNDKIQADECRLYIEQLSVPANYEVEVLVVTEAKSMTSGYNEAMNVSNAKYKIYLHHDVLIIKPDFLQTMLTIFQKHPEVGMFGVVGNESIAEDGGMWSDGTWRRTGEILGDRVYERDYSFFARAEGEFSEVIALDGLLMATQYDIPWREDLFQGWDYYDASQSVEFWKAGYKVVVPYMDVPWCLHENDLLNMADYDKWRRVFVREYKAYYKKWMEEHPHQRKMQVDSCLENKRRKVNEYKFCFILCANDEIYVEECLWYINRLAIPEGFEKETLVIRGASSMTSGYNQAMEKSDAKYKIYLHQDLFIVNRNILAVLLDIFQEDSIGMVGVLGKKEFLPAAEYTVVWDTGGVEVCNAVRTFYYNYNYASKEDYIDVVAIDGMFMATQYDLVWDEKNFDGWDFYDISQSVNFMQAGYRLVVPRISRDTLWCFHDSGHSEYYEWDRFRKLFCRIHADKGYVYRPLDYIRLNGDAKEKRQLAKKWFEIGDYIKSNQYLQEMTGEMTMDIQCSYMQLFLGVMSEELLVMNGATYVEPQELPVFMDEWNEVKFTLRRMYFGEDLKGLWQIIEGKLLSGRITMRLLCNVIGCCVFDSTGLRKIVFTHYQELLSLLIRKRCIGKAKQMIDQLKDGERGIRERLLKKVISVCQLEQERETRPLILDFSNDAEELICHYKRMEYYIRRLEFGCFDVCEREFYEYVTKTKVSDVFLLALMMEDVPYRKKAFESLAHIFQKNEGQHSARADLYARLVDEERDGISCLNEKRICFIICADNEEDVKDSQWYIERIVVPEGYETEVLVIRDASSMASGYNQAMAQTDAKYKVYLQAGVRVVNRNIILDLLEIFEEPLIGMVGVLGWREIVPPAAEGEWDVGTVEICYGPSSRVLSYSGKREGKWITAAGIDGMLMATQYDVLWEDDRSSYKTMRNMGYRLAVPCVSKENRWVFYDASHGNDRVWNKCLSNEEIEMAREGVWKVFLEGDLAQTKEGLRKLGEHHLDEKLSLVALFLLIRQEEIRKIGTTCWGGVNEFETFGKIYEKVICLLRRIYFASDDAAWKEVWVNLLEGNITLKMLQVTSMVCVGNPKKLWYQLLSCLEKSIQSLLRQGEVRQVEELLLQLDGEARGKLGNIVLRMIQVFYSEAKKEITPTVLDLTLDMDELAAHYVHLKYYLRRLEFSLPETYWQEVYDYIVRTNVSDYLMFHILQNDIFHKKMFCLNMAEMFAKYEGEQSVRAQLYLQLVGSEA